MVAGAIGTRHCSPGGAATDRADPIHCLGLLGGRQVTPRRVTHSLRDMNSMIVTGYWLLAVAQSRDSREAPLQERLWDDHK
jgi:hypothetical protein